MYFAFSRMPGYLEDVPLVEFVYHVFTRMPDERVADWNRFSLTALCVESTDWIQGFRQTLQPLQIYSSGHLGGWVAPWSAEEMLGGQHQRVDILNHTRTAHSDLPQKGLEKDLWWVVRRVLPDNPSGQGTELNWTELVKSCHIGASGLCCVLCYLYDVCSTLLLPFVNLRDLQL